MRTKAGWGDILPKEVGDPVFRRSFANPGTLLVMGIALLTLGVWLAQSPSSLNDPLTILAKVSAFSALSFLSLNFLLSTRARWLESLFGGLDRMYAAHCTVGRMSLLWMLLHPIALALSNLNDWDRLMSIFLPGAHIGHTIGTVSLALFVILLALTIVYSLPYANWLASHRLTGMVLLLAGYHALVSGSDIAAHPPLAAWTAVLTALGLVAFFYTQVLYRYLGRSTNMTVVGLRAREGSLDMILEHPLGFRFRPGQFVYVRFQDTDGEAHPYSISGWGENTIRLSIKASGDLTAELPSKLRIGAVAKVRGPYGRFGDKRSREKGEVWIAGGIGITPFLSFLQAEAEGPGDQEILLIWSYRVHGELPYEEEILSAAVRMPKMRFVHWNSKERGRVDASSIRALLDGELTDRRYMICGPRAMMRSLSRQLVEAGVRPTDIVLEDFNQI